MCFVDFNEGNGVDEFWGTWEVVNWESNQSILGLSLSHFL